MTRRALFALLLAFGAACSASDGSAPSQGAGVGGDDGGASGGDRDGDVESTADGGRDAKADAKIGDADENGDAHASGFSKVTGFGTNPGDLSMYLYVPKNLPAQDVPVVVALHGCMQTVTEYLSAGWNDIADEKSFVVVYPETSDNNQCFKWFDPAQARRGQGQALSIIEMVDDVKSKFDVGEVYVAGVSSGGAMTSVLLATYPEVFSAGAVMAGAPFQCANTSASVTTCMLGKFGGYGAVGWADLIRDAAPKPTKYPRVAAWHGDADSAVSPRNSTDLIAAWNEVHGIAQSPTSTRTVGPATYSQFADATGKVLTEEWIVSEMGHGAALDPANGCGVAAPYMLDVGLCSTRLAADFFFGNPGGGVTTPGAPWVCQDYYASTVGHNAAKRAGACTAGSVEICAYGSGDYIGLLAVSETAWVKETAYRFYSAGQCP